MHSYLCKKLLFLFSFLFSTLTFSPNFSSASSVVLLESETTFPAEIVAKARLQAHTDIFIDRLMAVSTVTPPLPAGFDIFILHDRDDGIYRKRAEYISYYLHLTGILPSSIYWVCSSDVHRHADKILSSQKVIVLGSPSLKAAYESGLGLLNQELRLLQTRLITKGKVKEGVLLTFFEGDLSTNYPESLFSLSSQSLGTDYHLSFFDILMNIYPGPSLSHPIKDLKEGFARLRDGIPPDIFSAYSARLLRFQEAQKLEVDKHRADIFERSHKDRESSLGSLSKQEMIERRFKDCLRALGTLIVAEVKPTCFISRVCTSPDVQWGDRIESYLRIIGIQTIYDKKDLNGGDDIVEFIKKIETADFVITLFSPLYKKNYERKTWIFDEAELVKKRLRKADGRFNIPVVLSNRLEDVAPLECLSSRTLYYSLAAESERTSFESCYEFLFRALKEKFFSEAFGEGGGLAGEFNRIKEDFDKTLAK